MALMRLAKQRNIPWLIAQNVKCLHTRSVVWATMHEGDPEVLEKEKSRNLKGETKTTIKDFPGWNEKLASSAEAAVKADKDPHPHETVEEHVETLHVHSKTVFEDSHKDDAAEPHKP